MKKYRKSLFGRIAGKAKFAVIASTLAVLPITGCYRIDEDKKGWDERLRENFTMKDDRAFDYSQYRPREFFHVFPKEVNLSDVPSKYSHFKDTNHFLFKEVLFNSSLNPFKVLYRNVSFEGEHIENVNRNKETMIVEDFGTDIILPYGSISRDDAFFFAGYGMGRMKLRVEYCGFMIDEERQPYSPSLQLVSQPLTCAHYTLVSGKENKREKKTSFNINWRTK